VARFLVKQYNIFPVPKNEHMLHLATIGYGLRGFMVMDCIAGPARGNTYIEEVVLTTIDFNEDVFANCKFIDDDALANDLAEFAADKGLIDQKKIAETLIDRGKFGWMTS